MKKMDEMDRNIRLRSEELGLKAAVFVLAVWVLIECWRNFSGDGISNPIPMLVLAAVLCVQGFSEMQMKRKMISGDEEYREPNKLLWSIISAIAIIAIIITIGFYLL